MNVILGFSDLPLDDITAGLSSPDTNSHLIVCVHGLAGSQFNELVLNEMRRHLSMVLPAPNVTFLMSEVNKVFNLDSSSFITVIIHVSLVYVQETNLNIAALGSNLALEVTYHIISSGFVPNRIR